ncbi:hypothetical protein B5P44_05335 [Mycobacterium sp. CBMA 213]|nr:hypothetical protein [Mycolicibacterium sp. CBMA 213]
MPDTEIVGRCTCCGGTTIGGSAMKLATIGATPSVILVCTNVYITHPGPSVMFVISKGVAEHQLRR